MQLFGGLGEGKMPGGRFEDPQGIERKGIHALPFRIDFLIF
jgi:hypothetical protein